MTNKKGTIFIVGAKGSGKSEFAGMLARALGEWRNEPVIVSECSAVLIDRLARIKAKDPVYDRLMPELFRDPEHWKRFLTARKNDYRETLIEIAEQMQKDKVNVIRECIPADIVCGVRRESEVRRFYDCHGVFERHTEIHLAQYLRFAEMRGDTWIFIERPGSGLATDSFDRSFFEKFCPLQVVNCGDKAMLENIARETARGLK